MTDAPDWQRVVVSVPSTGSVGDAPDWQRVAVGPGGAPIGGGGGTGYALLASDLGWNGWSQDSWNIFGTVTATTGGNPIYAALVKWSRTGTVTDMSINVVGTGTIIADENYLGIYSAPTSKTGWTSDATLLAQTGSGVLDSYLETLGTAVVPLESGLSVTAGDLAYLVVLINPAAANSVVIVGDNGYQPYEPMPIYDQRTWATTAYPTSLPATIAYSSITGSAVLPFIAAG